MNETLAVARVEARGAAPQSWMIFLHGILGSGANWRTFARALVDARPGWGAILVDLRLHGGSGGFAPPHTLAAAAADVIRSVPEDVRAVLGHSFGGKVALELSRLLAARPGGPPDDVFVVDATPGARPDRGGSSGVQHVVDLLTRLPPSFPSRDAFVAWIEERGISRPTAMWLAMNVRPADDGSFGFRIDVPSIRVLLDDYFHRDLWDVLASRPRGAGRDARIHVIAGGKSEALDDADLERARALAGVTVDVVAEAGHWVHVDAPEALRELVLGYLP